MEILVFNKDFELTKLIDAFNSFVWNDVYIGYGDFELEYPMSENALAYVSEGYYLQIKESERTMIIETIEIITSFTEGNRVKLSGRSLESVLDRRILREKVLVSGSLQDAIARMLNENIIKAKNQNRNIPGFEMKFSGDSRITELKIEAEYDVGSNLYDTIYKICEERHLGFKITLHNKKFFLFELYCGVDRSYNQTENAWVIFAHSFENLEDSNMKLDLTKLKTCVEMDYETTENITKPGGDPEKKVIVPLIIADELKSLDRREIYLSSNFEADAIDKASFGSAESRVDRYKYSSYQVIHFDSAGYNKAMADWNKKYSGHIASASKPKTTTITIALKPGDPGYVDTSETPGAEWINTRTETVTETAEEASKRASAYLSSLYSTQPKKSQFETWGWAIDDYAGYNKAITEAQAAIDKEFADAQKKAFDYAKAIVTRAGAEELCEYKTITSFDGKIDPNVNFIYRRDYDIGDIVQIVNRYNFTAVTRVTGVLFYQDNSQGIVVIPTFESDDAAIVSFDLPDDNEEGE